MREASEWMCISQREDITEWEHKISSKGQAAEGRGRGGKENKDKWQVGSLAQRGGEMSLSSGWWEMILKAGLDRISDLTKWEVWRKRNSVHAVQLGVSDTGHRKSGGNPGRADKELYPELTWESFMLVSGSSVSANNWEDKRLQWPKMGISLRNTRASRRHIRLQNRAGTKTVGIGRHYIIVNWITGWLSRPDSPLFISSSVSLSFFLFFLLLSFSFIALFSSTDWMILLF